MWRAVPLAKVIIRMAVFGAILGASLGLLTLIAFESTVPEPRSYYHPRIIFGGVTDGILLGALTGFAMAIYAAVAHRTIHKPSLFRFAFLIVATIVSLLVVQQPFHVVTLSEFGIPLRDWVHWALAVADPVYILLLAATIAKHVAIGLMSLYAAGKYMREASAQYMKSTGQRSA